MNKERVLIGLSMIAVPVVFATGFAGLQMVFEYPDILRQPAGEVLTRFAASGPELGLFWYLMMAAALAFVPSAIILGMYFRKSSPLTAALAAGFGILAGLVQALGLLRWVILVPALAQTYTAAGATEMDRSFAVNMFDAANRYLGMGVGEHFGYLFTALWTLSIAVLIWNRFRVLALAGIAIAAGIVAGMLEPFGMAVAGDINAISFSAWALWALLFGGLTLGDRKSEVAGMPQAA